MSPALATPAPRQIAVFDVGKTHLKFSAMDTGFQRRIEQRCPNPVAGHGPYPHVEVDAVWEWLLAAIAATPEPSQIDAIVVTTHGASAALLGEQGLVLPVLDYEYEGVRDLDHEYDRLRPDPLQTLSPGLPAGLNLGRQLYWQSRRFAQAWRQLSAILTYPQYWAWRLSGVMSSECTSLGCHTDLWLPSRHDFSELVDRCGWRTLFPPLRRAGDTLGQVLPELAKRTGLSPQCRVLCGIHDSNTAWVKLRRDPVGPRNLISSGTWVVIASLEASLDRLTGQGDMLGNVDAWGRPYACARFMGGREFAVLNPRGATDASVQHVEKLLRQCTLPFPSFSPLGGPYSHLKGHVGGPAPTSPEEDFALASLYLALMTEDALMRLGADGDLLIEGSLTANKLYAGLLAALRSEHRVWVSDDLSGTTVGAALLALPDLRLTHPRQPVEPLPLARLQDYRLLWRAALAGV